MENAIKKLQYFDSKIDGDYYTEIYHDEDGKRYDFVYEFKHIKTRDENGNWVEFDGEYEID